MILLQIRSSLSLVVGYFFPVGPFLNIIYYPGKVGAFAAAGIQYGDFVRNSRKGMVLYQTGQFFCQGVEKATFYYMVSRVKQKTSFLLKV